MKHCTQDERNAVFVEIRPHFITLATNTYAVHLVTKMLDNGNFVLIILPDYFINTHKKTCPFFDIFFCALQHPKSSRHNLFPLFMGMLLLFLGIWLVHLVKWPILLLWTWLLLIFILRFRFILLDPAFLLKISSLAVISCNFGTKVSFQ